MSETRSQNPNSRILSMFSCTVTSWCFFAVSTFSLGVTSCCIEQKPSVQLEKCGPEIIIPLSLWPLKEPAQTKLPLRPNNKCEEKRADGK